MSITLLGVDPNVAVRGELVLHATTNPGQEDSTVLRGRDVLPRHGSNLLDDLGRVEEVRICSIDVELGSERVLVARDEMHMGQLHNHGVSLVQRQKERLDERVAQALQS